MSKKNKPLANFSRKTSPAEDSLTRLKYPDLQRACVARGMPFEDAASGSILHLSSWFIKHYDNSQSIILINEFDDYKESIIKSLKNVDGTPKYKNDDAMFHPSLRLGFVGKRDDDGNVTQTKKPRLKEIKKDKPKKKERIEGTKVFTGTKKALTYLLTFEGKDFKTIWPEVSEQFPEAVEKSVKIWHKRALKENKTKK